MKQSFTTHYLALATESCCNSIVAHLSYATSALFSGALPAAASSGLGRQTGGHQRQILQGQAGQLDALRTVSFMIM